VAVGVAKADADVITVSGSEGGTGASPLVSIKHAGSPWELGVAEAHQALVAKGMRSKVILETDGGLRTGRDVVVAALLGAERFGFGTLPLLALGCKMVRQCHLNTCPVGIATQDLELRAKYTGAVDQVISLFRHLAEEIRHHMASLGARTMDELIGRADLLRPTDSTHPLAPDLAAILVKAQGRRRHEGYQPIPFSRLAERIVVDAAEAIRGHETVELNYPIQNTDRTVGARLSGEIAALHGDTGLAEGTIKIRLNGTAGQSLGAWLSPGVTLDLRGTANDYVAKGMAGGVVAVTPVRAEGIPHAAGNAVLYGATGGRVFLAGRVGQRFAVRNSGAIAVVEGCSDHACEYMTGGVVVVIGDVGRNFAAGMTGGMAMVWDPSLALKARLAETAPSIRRPGVTEIALLRSLLEEHYEMTSSPVAGQLLESETGLGDFWVVEPTGDVDHPSEIIIETAETVDVD
jgi:glutamate synthase domain-containing protein 3